MSSINSVSVKISYLEANYKGYAKMQVFISDKPDTYNSNIQVKTALTAEERASGVVAKIIGNGRTVYTDGIINTIPFKKN